MKLYGYWRSSAAYRVRIALNLKGLAYEPVPVDLGAEEQRQDAYRARNPARLVPFLEDGEVAVGQSLAIIDYLEERYPVPPLLPQEARARARARELALMIACEIHPLNNTRVLKRLRGPMGQTDEAVQAWYEHWIQEGFEAIELMLSATSGKYCMGDQPTLPDLCLVPQFYNARRYACNLEPYVTMRRIEAACLALPAFISARPEAQSDAKGRS